MPRKFRPEKNPSNQGERHSWLESFRHKPEGRNVKARHGSAGELEIKTNKSRRDGTHTRYTHSRAPFPQTQIYPTIRMARKIRISSSPNSPNALNFTAQGNKKIVSTSNTTNKIAMM